MSHNRSSLDTAAVLLKTNDSGGPLFMSLIRKSELVLVGGLLPLLGPFLGVFFFWESLRNNPLFPLLESAFGSPLLGKNMDSQTPTRPASPADSRLQSFLPIFSVFGYFLRLMLSASSTILFYV